MSIPKVSTRTNDPVLQRHAESINALIDGRSAVTGEITLTENSATTVVADNKFESSMVPVFVPLTANAAGALAGMYVSNRTQGGFTLTHANTATTDRTFGYLRFG